MGITSNKDINELARKAMRLGWRVFQTGRNHLRWVPPDDIVQKYGKAFVTSSLTPSDNYAINQIERDLRKAGLFHLEETLEKIKLDQTPEEKYLELGTSLPIPKANGHEPLATIGDVAPPELLKQEEVPEMAKKREREDRSEVRQEILRIVQERSPISTQALYDALPTRLKHGLKKGHLPGLIITINKGFPDAILSPQRGIYVKGSANYYSPEHKEQLSDPKAAPAEDLDASAILDEAVSVIAKLERLVRHLRERDAALSAVRKLLGNV